MIKFNTSNDAICKIVTKWCKENNYHYYFDTKNKDNNDCSYPFVIEAPNNLESDLLESTNITSK